MQLLRVGAASLNQTPLDWEGNLNRIRRAITAAKQDGIAVLCLPELCITGYGCEDAFYSRGLERFALAALHELAPETKGIAVSVGTPLSFQNALYNTACFLVDGEIRGFVAKQFLAGDGLYYEPRWFKPWPEDMQVTVDINGRSYPLGDLYFDLNGIRIGFEICEDAWVAKRPGADLALKGVDMILNPSASHFAFHKFEVRKRFVLEGSRAFGVSYLYANLLGNDSGRIIFDGGAIIASGGKLIATGPRFSFEDVVITSAVIDLDLTRTTQARTGSFKPTVLEEHEDRVSVPFSCPAAALGQPTPASPSWESGGDLKHEEFVRAVSLGLFDYLRKSHCHGFVVSLSGGVDSSAVACLVASLVKIGVTELGRDRFLAKLPKPERFAQCATTESIIAELLLCLYQATENSGPVTRNAAEKVAHAVGATFRDWNIDAQVKGYVALAEQATGRPLTWATDDTALQNIQARSRAPGVWLLANLRNSLLLNTSNRSEAAVGYATMDGDTAGALSPIGGIDKAYLRTWLRWMETVGPAGFGPIPALALVNAQQPTAELRPQSAHQTDEDDLMPYEILDRIERAFIVDRQTPLEIFRRLAGETPTLSSTDLATWIEKFFKLWCQNQWKRERYAPAFHLDDQSLDPKTWCRFPILSGGFAKELMELRSAISATPGSSSAPPPGGKKPKKS